MLSFCFFRGRSQLDDLQERTMQFNSDVAELSRLRDALGTKKDTHSFRNQLRIKREGFFFFSTYFG